MEHTFATRVLGLAFDRTNLKLSLEKLGGGTC